MRLKEIFLDYGYYTGSDQDQRYAIKGYLTGALIENKLAYSISVIIGMLRISKYEYWRKVT